MLQPLYKNGSLTGNALTGATLGLPRTDPVAIRLTGSRQENQSDNKTEKRARSLSKAMWRKTIHGGEYGRVRLKWKAFACLFDGRVLHSLRSE